MIWKKKKILAILPNNQELQGNIYNVKLYSSDIEDKLAIQWIRGESRFNCRFSGKN